MVAASGRKSLRSTGFNAELGALKSYAFLKDKWPREKEWEQVRLYRRDIVQRWPSPLSLIQDELTGRHLVVPTSCDQCN